MINSFNRIFIYASIAQSVEHAAVNRGVVGSSPTRGVLARWLSWLERRPVTAEVDGSSPFRVAASGVDAICRRGGIGRRPGLKILWSGMTVPVRPRSPAGL